MSLHCILYINKALFFINFLNVGHSFLYLVTVIQEFFFFQVIILTLKKAAPNVARFLLCAVLLYAGFTFCGWLILGPYHMKVHLNFLHLSCSFFPF
jgi:hypothetical protein